MRGRLDLPDLVVGDLLARGRQQRKESRPPHPVGVPLQEDLVREESPQDVLGELHAVHAQNEPRVAPPAIQLVSELAELDRRREGAHRLDVDGDRVHAHQDLPTLQHHA